MRFAARAGDDTPMHDDATPRATACAVFLLLLAATAHADDQPTRLRVVNGCDQPLWVFHQIGAGGGLLDAPAKVRLAARGDYLDYPIPAAGLAATRFWPGLDCDAAGDDCRIGQSGGPAGAGFTCPAGIGCAPPVDSKFEGTFGCLPPVAEADCQGNPSSSPPGRPLPRHDGWGTSLVDGYTLAYRVEVIGDCPGGPAGNTIDCSALRFADCPTDENLDAFGNAPGLRSVDLHLAHPRAGRMAGCYSPCMKLTGAQWQSLPNPPFTGATYAPADPQARPYCCPGDGVDACRNGPVIDTRYVRTIHAACPQTYAYAYDDVTGNFACPAGVKYRVTFFCPQ